MATRGQDIVSILKQQIQNFGAAVTMVDVGTVIEVGDGITRIHGLAAAKYNELLQFPNDIMGIALNLEEDSVSAIVLGDYTQIKEGDEVKSTGRIAEVPVGNAMLGRVVDALGRPLDGRGAVKTSTNTPGRTRGAERRLTRAGGYAGADRHQSSGQHVPHRARPARAHHRRPLHR